MPLTAAQQQSMLKLEEAAKRLRESIAAMKGKSDAAGGARAVAWGSVRGGAVPRCVVMRCRRALRSGRGRRGR